MSHIAPTIESLTAALADIKRYAERQAETSLEEVGLWAQIVQKCNQAV